MKNMTNNSNDKTRYFIIYCILILLMAIFFVLNITIGSVKIEIKDILGAIFSGNTSAENKTIIMQIRLPRLLMAMLLGGALSISGFLLQTYFSNPIAGPYILGISSGAKLAVALTLILVLKNANTASSVLLICSSFVGALISVGFVLILARKIRSMSVLLVGGIMISYICSAITDFLITFADDSDIVNLHGWSLGSFSGQKWENVAVASVIVILSLIATFALSKQIGAYLLGENYALSMGLNVRIFRVVLILLSSIMAATVTAFAGPISFVGIAIPHLIKRVFNTSKPVIIIPGIFFGGSLFCLFSDLIARSVFCPTELNISTVTAVFGAPIVISMLLKRNSE